MWFIEWPVSLCEILQVKVVQVINREADVVGVFALLREWQTWHGGAWYMTFPFNWHTCKHKVYPSAHGKTHGEFHTSVSLWLRVMVSWLTIISCVMSQIGMLHSQPLLTWILIPHSDWFISETPQQIMHLINLNDASIPTSFFPFLPNFRGLMRNAWENRNTIKAEKLYRKTAGWGHSRYSVWLCATQTPLPLYYKS